MDDILVPDELTCSDQIFDLNFHPIVNGVLSLGLIDGKVDIWKYKYDGEHELLFQNSRHTSSCRGVCFSTTGDRLYTISSDKSIQCLDISNNRGKELLFLPNAHNCPINKVINVSENVIATGDDNGEVKLWDMRVNQASVAAVEVMSWKVHEDFISDFIYESDKSCLLSISGDSTLGIYDIRNQNTFYRSDEQESELQCIQILKGGNKIVCGTQDGVILIFSWNRWGDCSDRYPGHPEPVDCMYKIDESTIVTGSSDGLIRVVAIQPNKILGVIGEHEEFPVEGIRANSHKTLLGSFSHDSIVRFWDISMFIGETGDDDDNDIMCDNDNMNDNMNDNDNIDDMNNNDEEDEEEEDNWEEMEESDSDSSSNNNNDSDDSIDQNNKGRKLLPTANEKFFADL